MLNFKSGRWNHCLNQTEQDKLNPDDIVLTGTNSGD